MCPPLSGRGDRVSGGRVVLFAPQYRIMRHPELAEVFVRELASRAKTNDRSRRRMEAGIHKRLRLAFNGKSNIFLGKPTKFLTRSLPRPTAVVLVGLPRSVKPHLSKLRCGSASLTQDDAPTFTHCSIESGYVFEFYSAQTPSSGSGTLPLRKDCQPYAFALG